MSHQRVSDVPEKVADLCRGPGNFWGSRGNFQGSLGKFQGSSELLLHSTVREVPGKSPANSQKGGGNSGRSRDFPEAQGNPTPSQRHAKIVSK